MQRIFRLWLLAFATVALGQDEGEGLDQGSLPEHGEPFDLMELPQGASVTLPHPAATLAPAFVKITLTPSDKKQIVKISCLGMGATQKSLKLAIFDSNQKRVQYLSLKPQASLVYHFKNLRSIQIIPQEKIAKNPEQFKLLLESNRPLGVGYNL